MNIKIRLKERRPEDDEWLFQLHKQAMYPHIVSLYGKWDEAREKEYFEDESKMARYKLVLSNEEKVGAINFLADGSKIKVNRIEVLPEHQDKGIGSAVLDELINQARQENKNIELRVFKHNPAKKLYERKGFQTYEEDETHYYLRYQVWAGATSRQQNVSGFVALALHPNSPLENFRYARNVIGHSLDFS